MRWLQHALVGCAGHVEHECDERGVWWIGLRCAHCGKLAGKMLSAVPPVPVKSFEVHENISKNSADVLGNSYEKA
jgi:hypothetical protein